MALKKPTPGTNYGGSNDPVRTSPVIRGTGGRYTGSGVRTVSPSRRRGGGGVFESEVEAQAEEQGRSAQARQRQRIAKKAARKAQVEAIRGRGQDLRTKRMRARVSTVENSPLGQPLGEFPTFEAVIGERWNRGTNQSIPNSSFDVIEYGAQVFTVEDLGYQPIYSDTAFTWTIPAGLGGLWELTGLTQFASNSTGVRAVRVLVNGSDSVYEFRVPAAAATNHSLPINLKEVFEEGDYFEVQVFQNSGGALDINGGNEVNHLAVQFLGLI